MAPRSGTAGAVVCGGPRRPGRWQPGCFVLSPRQLGGRISGAATGPHARTRFAASNRGAAPLLAVRPAATRRVPLPGRAFRRIGWSTGPRSRAGLPLRPGC